MLAIVCVFICFLVLLGALRLVEARPLRVVDGFLPEGDAFLLQILKTDAPVPPSGPDCKTNGSANCPL